jgi:hypothetical protein
MIGAVILAAAAALSTGRGLAASPPPRQDADKTRAELVISTLDTDGDRRISCQELVLYLNPKIATVLRKMGVEPHVTSHVPSCGPRDKEGPGDGDEESRSPEKNYEEFLRGLIRGTLNTAASDNDGDDAITLGEVMEVTQKSLPSPLTGTLGDLLPNAPATPPAASEAWTDTLEKWVDIRQSFLDEQGIGKPAKFSLTDHGEGDETLAPEKARRVYQFLASFVFTPQFEWALLKRVHVRPVAAYEVNVSSDTPAKDQIVHRIGVSTVVVRDDARAPFSSHLIDLTFDYLTNRRYRAEVYGATLQYSPNYRQLGIGQYLRRGAAIDFRWRPYVGVVWRDVQKADVVEAYQKQKDFTHRFLRVTGELKMSSRVKLTPEIRLWRGDRTSPEGAVDEWHSQRSLETRLVMSQAKGVDRASVTLTLTRGKDSPDFLNQKTTLLAFAFKF